METRIDILNELRELSQVLSALEKVNVYTVPENYFDQLPDLLLSINKVEDPSFLASLSKHSVQEVPAGYFDGLADNILSRIKSEDSAETELKELSPLLAEIPRTNVYQVPDGYFDSVAELALSNVNADQKTAAEELRALSPMLYSIQNEKVYEVPRGYFNDLAEDILSKVRPAKVVTMKRRSNNFIKYAVAAMFTGVIALSVFKFTSNTSDKLDPSVAQGTQIAQKNTFDQELANVNESDIVKYLEDNGTDVKAALVATSADESQLPTQEDYLLDDKTLDNYLNSIDVNSLKN
jgi:hypothetical protein